MKNEQKKQQSFHEQIKAKYEKSLAALRLEYARFCAIWRGLRNKKQRAVRLYAYIKESQNQQSISLCKKMFAKVMHQLLPRRGSGYVKLGTGDPYMTGKVMELAAFLYPLYGKQIRVTPVFDESALEGELHVQGRIHLFVLLYAAARLFFDRNLRRMCRHIRREADLLMNSSSTSNTAEEKSGDENS